MDVFYELAFKHLEDEIEDACEYIREADEANEDGKEYLALGLQKVAMDEYTHAEFLRNYLMSKGHYHHYEKHDELEEHWHKLCHKLGFE
jgi:hypothetical protein